MEGHGVAERFLSHGGNNRHHRSPGRPLISACRLPAALRVVGRGGGRIRGAGRRVTGWVLTRSPLSPRGGESGSERSQPRSPVYGPRVWPAPGNSKGGHFDAVRQNRVRVRGGFSFERLMGIGGAPGAAFVSSFVFVACTGCGSPPAGRGAAVLEFHARVSSSMVWRVSWSDAPGFGLSPGRSGAARAGLVSSGFGVCLRRGRCTTRPAFR